MRFRFFALMAVVASLMAGGCASVASNANPAPVSPRTSIDLNSDWRFTRQDADGSRRISLTSFDDSTWQAVQLPHTWNNLDGQDGGNNYYRGAGWYRRKLPIGPELAGKSLFLKFDGASSVADIYVNGQRAGGHKGAFAAFVCDATQLLHPGPDNVIAVRVSNAWDANLPPLDGDFTMFGGLYRPVHLLALDPLSITPLDEGGPGVYAAQTSVTPAMAQLHVTAKLRNGGAAAKSASVQFQILDAAGQPVQCASTERIIPADGSADAVYDISLPSPHLWNGRKDPYLYTLRVIISDGLTVVDALDQPLGLRFFAVDPDKGFLLNGQPYPLHGVNRHQDRLDMGWAIGPAEQQEDFNLIMEMGCTGIRLAHYQQAQDFYDRCDRGGLVVWAEAALVNYATNSQAFDDAALQQVRELVKQNFNHPAICFWSLFNELRATRPQADGQLDADTRHQLDLIAKLNNQAHEIDSTRLTTAASNANLPNDPLNTITDVIAYNGYFGWYAGTPASWPEYLDGLRSARPGRAVGISEYGAGASIFEHEIAATQPTETAIPWHPEEWQTTLHEAAWAAM